MIFFRDRDRPASYERATQETAEILEAYIDLASTLPAGTQGCDAYRRLAVIAFQNWRYHALRSSEFRQADEDRLLEIFAQDH